MKNTIYGFIALYIIWVILMGNLSPLTLVSGVIISILCMWFVRKFFPLDKIKDVRFHKLILFLPYIVKEIYLQGFGVIRKIFSAAEPEVIIYKTELKSEFLKAVLVNSVTLTPGSIALNIQEDKLTVLNLTYKNKKAIAEEVTISEDKTLDNVAEVLTQEPIELRLLKVECKED